MREFEELTSIESVKEYIQEYPLTFLYIFGPHCSVCHALKPQVLEVMMKYPQIKLISINAEEVREVAGAFSIFTLPVMLLFVEGREYVREARFVHMELFDDKINNIYGKWN